jgi:hypothetical protein
MNLEARVIKNLTKEIVYGTHKSQLTESVGSPGIDFKKLKYLFFYHELSAYAYVLLKERYSVLPGDFFEFLKDSHYFSLFSYMNLYGALLDILRSGKENDILLMPIKGLSYSEEYYKRFGLRPIVDIDLLVKIEDLEQGVGLLEKMGYQKYLAGGTEGYWRKNQCHLEFIRDDKGERNMVELHWALDAKRYQREPIPGLWSRLKKCSFDGQDGSILSPEDTLLSLALHQRRYGKVFNLKYVCDIGLILEKESLDWGYLLKTAHKGKARASLYFLIYQVQFVLDKDLKKRLDALRIPFWQRWLIHRLTHKYIYAPPDNSRLPYVFLFSHFLLYDDPWYPFQYILNIPEEQFAKFYNLKVYSKECKLRHRLRFFYFFYSLFKKFMQTR